MYTFYMDTKLIGERPPLPLWAREYLKEITEELNVDSVVEFTDHNVLLMVIDRAHIKMFPERKSHPKRKKYDKIPF